MMIRRIGIEVRTAGVYHNLAEQPSCNKLMKRVVDSGERHFDRCRDCFFVKPFRRYVPITILEQQAGEGQPLPCRPKLRPA